MFLTGSPLSLVLDQTEVLGRISFSRVVLLEELPLPDKNVIFKNRIALKIVGFGASKATFIPQKIPFLVVSLPMVSSTPFPPCQPLAPPCPLVQAALTCFLELFVPSLHLI